MAVSAAVRSMRIPSRSHHVASHSVQVRNWTPPSSMFIATDSTSVDPHCPHRRAALVLVRVMGKASARGGGILHSPRGPFSTWPGRTSPYALRLGAGKLLSDVPRPEPAVLPPVRVPVGAVRTPGARGSTASDPLLAERDL